MKVIICGAGLVGYDTARCLIEESNDVTVVDNNAALIARVNDNLDCRGILGHACSPDVLDRAGVKDVDMIIAVTRYDEVNMVACQVAGKLFNVPRKLARIRNQTYLKPEWNLLFSTDGCPIDVIISPEKAVAEAIVRRIRTPGALDVLPIGRGKVCVLGVQVANTAKVFNTPIAHLIAEYANVQMNILAIIRAGKIIVPTEKEVILPEDTIYFVCVTRYIKYCLGIFGHNEERCSRLLIIGGGNVGSYVAKAIEDDENTKLCIIESNKNVASKLAENMPSTTIINGDALNLEILEEAGIVNSDICISVTNDDESNLFTSLLAKKSGVDKTISLINNPAYLDLTGKLGIDNTVNPREITASIILQSIRHGSVKSLYALQDNIAEVMELEVHKESEICGKTRQQLKLPKGVYFALVIRGTDIFAITDKTLFMEKDRVILLTMSKIHKKIVEVFSPLTAYY